MRYLIFILLFSISWASEFDTKWGPCTLEIYGGKIENIDAVKNLILTQTKLMVDEWGAVQHRPFSVYITANKADFYKKAKGPIPEWGIAVAKRNPDRIIIQAPHVSGISFSRLLEVVIHELNHVFLNRIKFSHTFPSWYKEGLAMRQADEFSFKHRLEISKAKWNNRLHYFNDLESFNRVKKSNSTLAYAQSAAMVYALEYYYGNDIHDKIIATMQQGSPFWKTVESITSHDKTDIQINMEIFIEENYNWMFLANASKLIFIFLPIILVGGFLYKRQRNKKILKRWEIEEELEKLNDENSHLD